MKMRLVKLCELLAASFLFSLPCYSRTVMYPVHPEPCSCTDENALEEYCDNRIAVKLQVLDVIEKAIGKTFVSKRYKIKITKVFKGPKSVKRIRVLDIPETSPFCYYEHSGPFNKDEYVFTGALFRNYLTTTLCDFHKKWDSVSYEDKRGFEGDFKHMCL